MFMLALPWAKAIDPSQDLRFMSLWSVVCKTRTKSRRTGMRLAWYGRPQDRALRVDFFVALLDRGDVIVGAPNPAVCGQEPAAEAPQRGTSSGTRCREGKVLTTKE
jgi:hypothetical protein